MMLYDVLSLWEIAHRWHDQDPNLTDPKALPLKVQDTLRFLTRVMWRHELRICTYNGIEHDNQNDLERSDEILSRHEGAENLSLDEQEEIYEQYYAWHKSRIKFHCDAVEGFEECFNGRVYDKERLDHTYTPKHGLAEACIEYAVPLPDFWYSKDEMHQFEAVSENATSANTDINIGLTTSVEPSTTTTQKLRPNQIARQICEAIAQTLWDEHPGWNIVQIIEHRAIQQYGRGAYYGPDTLRDWVKEFDPRPVDKRRGRPKKITAEQPAS